MTYEETLSSLKECDLTMKRYERESWDKFLQASKFSISFPFVHIAGSNGKGSTANYLYSIYRAKGYKVALFSKPFVHDVNEMIRVNDKNISNADFARLYSEHEKEFDRYSLSSFERETFIAFAYFNEQKPDLAIIECGMGGYTDSTNILSAKPLLSIITTISLEHTSFLGVSLSEIAENKAGIIKNECPVLLGKLPEEAMKKIREIAKLREAPLFTVDDYHFDHYEAPYFRFSYRPYNDLAILTAASYQLLNASLALEATKILSTSFPVDELAVRKGLLSEPLPCRYEKHHNVIIDGAHNPEAIKALMNTIERSGLSYKTHVLFASFRDKNIASELPIIANSSCDITLTTFPNERARDEMDYFLFSEDYHFNPDYRAALNNLLALYPDDYILVTGSLAFTYLVMDYVIDTLKL